MIIDHWKNPVVNQLLYITVYVKAKSDSQRAIKVNITTWNPNDPVLIGKDIVLEGWSPKIGDKQVSGNDSIIHNVHFIWVRQSLKKFKIYVSDLVGWIDHGWMIQDMMIWPSHPFLCISVLKITTTTGVRNHRCLSSGQEQGHALDRRSTWHFQGGKNTSIFP